MSKLPTAGLETEGRVLGTDWSIANVAKLLRSNGQQGSWQETVVDRYYLRKVSAKHLPTNVSVIFMRVAKGMGWYASLCFAGNDEYLPWDPDVAEEWLCALFGDERPWIREEAGENASVRQYFGPLRH